MYYKTGTYIAFDGQGETNPCKSDFKYFSAIKGWNANKNIDFKYNDSHSMTYAVRDTSSKETLRKRIKERMSLSKNMVIILSVNTRKSGSELSYEIEQAVDFYKLPLIITYTDVDKINSQADLIKRWPNVLVDRILNKTASAVHIPFREEIICECIKKYSVNGTMPRGSFDILD